MPKNSNYQRTILNSVIRDSTGRLKVRQCRPKIHYHTVKTQQRIAFERLTVGDITNKLRTNNQLRDIILHK